jgi:hypothetical protein
VVVDGGPREACVKRREANSSKILFSVSEYCIGSIVRWSKLSTYESDIVVMQKIRTEKRLSVSEAFQCNST